MCTFIHIRSIFLCIFVHKYIQDSSLFLKVQISTHNIPKCTKLATFDVLGLLTLEDIAFLRNVECHLANDIASHSRTLESSARYLTYERKFLSSKVGTRKGKNSMKLGFLGIFYIFAYHLSKSCPMFLKLRRKVKNWTGFSVSWILCISSNYTSFSTTS
jgi:hypothetical protein